MFFSVLLTSKSILKTLLWFCGNMIFFAIPSFHIISKYCKIYFTEFKKFVREIQER